jgi:hypothetical protein
MIDNVISSVDFRTYVYDLNPGLAASFPWLSTMAADWQQYRFHTLRFRYVTRSATSVGGSVMLCPTYNPKQVVPTDERTLMNAASSVEDAPWKNFYCPLDVNGMFPTGPRKWIREGAAAGDLSTYDVGRLFVGTTGNSGISEDLTMGKLWVDYDVEFFLPVTETTISELRNSTQTVILATIDQNVTDATLTQVKMGSIRSNPCGIAIDGPETQLTFPKGNFTIWIQVNVAGTLGSNAFMRATLSHLVNVAGTDYIPPSSGFGADMGTAPAGMSLQSYGVISSPTGVTTYDPYLYVDNNNNLGSIITTVLVIISCS